MKFSAFKIVRAILLGGVSYTAFAISSRNEVQAQSPNLPPVTVDAPRPRPAARPAPTRRAAPATRRVARVRAAPQRTAPVPYLAPSASTIGAPPTPYAGGQVATGAQLGFLGNRGVMDTPFSVTSYTDKLILDQQARTIGDVVQNDPSVRLVTVPGGAQDAFFIRGFYYDSSSLALNGLYGVGPFYSVGANFAERVEVLKGPSVLLNGTPPAGTVGGSINVVTKKAPDFDITQLTATYLSRSNFGTLVDIARRYGEQKEWGVRFNGSYRNGATQFDRQNDEFGNAVLGLDYRGERIRASLDLGYQAENTQPLQRFVGLLTTTLPAPPRASTTFVQPWTYYKTRDTFGTAKAEADITDWATVYGSIGYNRSTNDFLSIAPNILTPNPVFPYSAIPSIAGAAPGLYASRPFLGYSSFDTISAEAGARFNFDTGVVNHAVTTNYSATNRSNYNDFRQTPGAGLAPFIFSNIYNPVDVPYPSSFIQTQRNTATTFLDSVGVADTMSILDKRVQFTAGVRRQSVNQENLSYLPAGALVTSLNTSSTEAVWSPAFALLVRPVSYLSLYANYIEGLLPGETVSSLYANAGSVLAPYTAKQAEAGVKVDFGRIATTFSVFEITQRNTIGVGDPLAPILRADGQQRNRGAEINAFGEITPEWRVLGGVAFIDGRQVKTEGGLNDGKKAVGVGNVQLNIGTEYDIPFVRGLTLGGRAVYTDTQAANPGNTIFVPSWTRFDIQSRYTFLSPWNGKPIVIRAAIENVANKNYWQAAYAGGALSLGAPRTYLVSTTFNF